MVRRRLLPLAVILAVLLISMGVWVWLRLGEPVEPVAPAVDHTLPFRLQVTETPLGSPDLPRVLREHVRVSPDARHLSYVDHNRRELVLDGEPLCKLGGGIGLRLEFSPNGKHLAIVRRQGGLWHVVVDGQAGKGYQSICNTIAPTRDHVTYFRFNPNGHEGEYIAMDDGRPVRVVVDLSSLQHTQQGQDVLWTLSSPDGHRLAEVIRRDDKVLVSVDGLRVGVFDEIKCFSSVWRMAWSPDSCHLAYVARLGEYWHMVVGGQTGMPFRHIQDGPHFSPDGKRMHYQGRIRSSEHATVLAVLSSSQEQKAQETLLKDKWTISFSPDGTHMARTNIGDIIIDEVELPKGPKVLSGVVWNADGSRRAWWISYEKGCRPIIDGQEGSFSEIVTPLWFSPDGQRIMYLVSREGKYHLVVDGIEGPEYELIPYQSAPPVWSCDSKHVAYLARKKAEKGQPNAVLVVDGVEAEPYDLGMWQYGATVIFDEPDRVRTVMFRQGQALRLDVTVKHDK